MPTHFLSQQQEEDAVDVVGLATNLADDSDSEDEEFAEKLFLAAAAELGRSWTQKVGPVER